MEHEAVYTVEEAQEIQGRIDGVGCKNLFLTDNKKKYFLVILEENKKADLKQIGKMVNVSHLSFARAHDLNNILKLEQGSVSPFGIINDMDNKVVLLIDKDLKDKKLLFHPNVNTKTVSIKYDDLIKFIKFEKHIYINL